LEVWIKLVDKIKTCISGQTYFLRKLCYLWDN